MSKRPQTASHLPFSPGEQASIEAEAHRLGFKTVADYLLDLHIKAALVEHAPALEKKKGVSKPRLAFSTDLGSIYCGDSASYMRDCIEDETVDAIVTSPPFGLVKKKDYGNEDADRYLAWFEQFATQFSRILKPSGSLVIDIGGAWKPGEPTRSLYHYELVIMLCRKFGFHLAQEFYWWNPARIPGPAEWVNIRRIRVKDAVNCVWWLSKTPYPKASNRRVLQPYTERMKHLFKNGYNRGPRPSGWDVSDKFGRDNGGAIPPNLIALANTESNSGYQRYCRERNIKAHPARFPAGLPSFFLKMLTDPGDFVLDPFAGSCVTGAVAEQMGRRWTCCELNADYVEGAKGRFEQESLLPELSLSPRKVIPYEILPPCTSLIDDLETPLQADGGRSRPKATGEGDPPIEEA